MSVPSYKFRAFRSEVEKVIKSTGIQRSRKRTPPSSRREYGWRTEKSLSWLQVKFEHGLHITSGYSYDDDKNPVLKNRKEDLIKIHKAILQVFPDTRLIKLFGDVEYISVPYQDPSGKNQ